MKKDYFVIEDSSKNIFGGGQKISLLVIEIISRGSEVVLFDTNSSSKFAKQSQKYISEYYSLYKFSRSANGLLGFFYRLIEIITMPFFVVINIGIIRKATKKAKNKVFYAATKKSLIIAYILNKISGSDFIYHNHLIEHNIIVKLFLKHILKPAKYVIAVSDVVKNNLNLPNVIKIYNPVELNPTLKPRKIGETMVVVAFFGSLIKIKGLKYFLDSYKFLDTNIGIKYRVFGDGPDKVIFENYDREKIKFKGFTNNVFEEMQEIDLLCQPSIIEESLGMVILEALVSGIPVITTNIGGQAELIVDKYNGMLVPIKNSRAIAEKITYIVKNKEFYTDLSENAIESSKKFDYTFFEKQIQNLFLSIG